METKVKNKYSYKTKKENNEDKNEEFFYRDNQKHLNHFPNKNIFCFFEGKKNIFC